MKKIELPLTEEEQAQKIARETAMKEVAWEAFCYYYNRFHTTDGDNEPDEKDTLSGRMGYWLDEYRELTEE